MKSYLVRAALFFLTFYSAKAQSLLDLHRPMAYIESFNSKNEITGGGILNIQAGKAGYVGILRDDEGQTMEFVSRYEYKNTDDGLEVALQFYVNPSMYAPDLEVEYKGGKVFFPKELSIGQRLEEVSGTHTFSRGEKPFITERAILTNRKVTGTEEMEFRGGKAEAYVVGSTFEVVRIHRINTTRSVDQIREWYIPGEGIVKSERHNHNNIVIFRLK